MKYCMMHKKEHVRFTRTDEAHAHLYIRLPPTPDRESTTQKAAKVCWVKGGGGFRVMLLLEQEFWLPFAVQR